MPDASLPGAATTLVFSASPIDSKAGSTFSTPPVVQVKDANGITVTNTSASITLTISAGTETGGTLLSGTTTVNAASGVATFKSLSINLAGQGYTLTATSGTLNSANSTAFNVVHPGDANGDGIITMGDVTKVERIILGLDPPTAGADANNDGSITMGDVTKIERIILGLDPLVG